MQEIRKRNTNPLKIKEKPLLGVLLDVCTMKKAVFKDDGLPQNSKIEFLFVIPAFSSNKYPTCMGIAYRLHP